MRKAQPKEQIRPVGFVNGRAARYGRSIGIGVLLTSFAMLGSCAIPFEYVPDLRSGGGATVVIRAANTRRGVGWDNLSHQVLLDIYDFKSGCPNVGLRMKSGGYKGSVTLTNRATTTINVPSGERIVLRGAWSAHNVFSHSSCEAILTFIPETGSEYLFSYRGPSEQDRKCGASLAEVVEEVDGKSGLDPVPSLALPTVWRGFAGYDSPELCALKPK